MDPKNAEAHYNIGRVYSEMGNIDKASQELEAACLLQPDYPPALYMQAEIARAQHHLQKSTSILQKVVALAPKYSDAQYLLGRNAQDLGKKTEAMTHWRLALKADPNNSRALYSLAQALNKAGDPQGKVYMSHYLDLQKQRLRADRIRTLANFGLDAADHQKWDLVVSDFEQAIAMCGSCQQSEQIHRDFGLVLARKGDSERARHELETALKLDPHDDAALKAMELLNSHQSSSTSAN